MCGGGVNEGVHGNLLGKDEPHDRPFLGQLGKTLGSNGIRVSSIQLSIRVSPGPS